MTYFEIEMCSKSQEYADNWNKESCCHPGNCMTAELVEFNPAQDHNLNQKQQDT
jgi:hypothetical protein